MRGGLCAAALTPKVFYGVNTASVSRETLSRLRGAVMRAMCIEGMASRRVSFVIHCGHLSDFALVENI